MRLHLFNSAVIANSKMDYSHLELEIFSELSGIRILLLSNSKVCTNCCCHSDVIDCAWRRDALRFPSNLTSTRCTRLFILCSWKNFFNCLWIATDSLMQMQGTANCTMLSARDNLDRFARHLMLCPLYCSSSAAKWVKVRLLPSKPCLFSSKLYILEFLMNTAPPDSNSVYWQNFMGGNFRDNNLTLLINTW